jgi:hypothetical protein
MTAAVTIAPDVRDHAVIEVFERHIVWEARPCLICGKPGGPECVTCVLFHDQKMRRAEDV